MSRLGRFSIGVVLLTMLVGPVGAAQSDVDIPMADGIVLKGTYFSPGAPGPAVLLLQQCDRDRHAWLDLASDLAVAGIHVLTIDFRGLGQSGGRPGTTEERQSLAGKWPGDVDAAFAFLLAQKGVDQSQVAVGGASCGVPQAANLVMRQHRIRVLLVLAGPTTDDAKKYMSQTPGLAVFGVAAEGDSGAVEGVTELVKASTNSASTLKLYSGTDHGVALFSAHKELQPLIVSWMKTQLH